MMFRYEIKKGSGCPRDIVFSIVKTEVGFDQPLMVFDANEIQGKMFSNENWSG